jgi:PAS domain S-box-containing protein
MDKFARQVNAVQRRTDTLNRSVCESSSMRPDLLVQAFDQLNGALDELRVTHEELQKQNEQSVDLYRSIESERQHYRNLFEFAPDAYIVTDTNGKIVDVNRAAAKLFQISLNDWTNKSLVDFLPEQKYHIFRSQLLELPQEDISQNSQDWEVDLYKADGTKFCAVISVSTAPHAANRYWHWLIRDISALKQTEESRTIQSENLQFQETARLKSQFMAMMSHELRTPMHIILGFAQLLLRQPVFLSPQLKTMVERIVSNAKHLLTLIEDILDFTSLEAGRLSLESKQFNLYELIQATAQSMQPLASQKQLLFKLDIKLPNHTMTGDSKRLRQILVNLLDNAIKFTDKGTVELEAYEIPTNRVAILVRDTGIGIAQSDIKYIFQEFRQVNQTYSRRHGGTGLGLAIVDKLVKLMQGTVSVESQIGKGSTFRIELPIQVESAEC